MGEAAQARARQEEEARRQQSIGLNWATAANSLDQGGAQKSLAEIQAEEQRQERDRQERERREKKARQKDMNMSLAQASVWGSASTNLSWANKTAPPIAPVSNPAPVQQQPSAQYGNNTGFWDNVESPPVQQQQKQQPQQQQQQQQKKNKNNKK